MVYHDTWMTDDEKPSIKFHRHAEIIVPGEMDLTALRVIWCRSEAESTTLLSLLPPQAVKKYGGKIRQGRRPNLHFNKWTFIEGATLEQNQVSFVFNASTQTPGPFAASLSVHDRATGKRYNWSNMTFNASGSLAVGIPQIQKPCAYDVRFTLDEAVAYAGHFKPESIPF